MTSRRWLSALLLTVCFIPTFAHALGNEPSERIRRIEATTYPLGWPGSDTEAQLTPAQWMELLKVPGISVAVIDDYRIVWTKEYGWADVEKKQPVAATTLFQAGSISKPVTAVGVMTLVEAGALSLDANVNDYLKTWKVPDNEFTKTEKVTLRRLLSHTAGTTVHGFPGYAVGEARPTLVQILNGEKPANTKPVRVDVVPGTIHRYSGGGTTIAQLAVMEATGKPFEVFMRQAVLSKAGMAASTYEQPLPEKQAASTATGYRGDGSAVEGRWHIYPEMAAAGLWTTASDLARFAIEMMRAKQGKSKMLSQKSADLMLTPVKGEAALGFFIDPKTGRFGHNGADEGFQAMLLAFPNGKGVALMSNSDNGTAAMYRFLWAIAAEYGMELEGPKRSFGGTMYYLALRNGAKAAIAQARKSLQAGKPPFEIKDQDLNNAAFGLLSAKRGEEALALLDYNLELHPQSSAVYQARAAVNRELGKKADALRDARKAVELDAKNDGARELIRELEGK